MSDCCNSETKKSEMSQFVREKAKNFKMMLEPFCITSEQKDSLNKYNEDDLEILVKEHLALLYNTGTLLVAQQAIINTFNIEDQAIQIKIGRYLQCFCECILD